MALTGAELTKDGFRKLFEDYYDLICNYLNGQTHDWDLSQEIAQKTFVKIWEKRSEIVFTSSSKSYLYQVARNTLIDYYRSHKSASTNAERYADQLEQSTEIEMIDNHNLELTRRIAWAVNQLKPKTRQIFLMSKQEGLTYEEIADYLEISKRTVEYNMKNALLKLQELLKDQLN